MSKDWNLHLNDNVDESIRGAAYRGLLIAGEHVLGESNKTVPIEEYTLGRSGTVTGDRSRLRAAVSYDTPYAVRQHEDMTFRHDPGRTAKYLENALNDHATIKAIIAAAIRGEI
jgi:hypothetical protein